MKKSVKNTNTIPDEYSLYMMRNYVRDLRSQNGLRRQSARLAMVAIGEPAIDILAALAIHPQWKIRWEAVKALSQMKNAVTAPVLINALEDEYESIRWIAAQGLINLGKQGLISVLEALSSYKLTAILRQGAHHVIKEISKRYPLSGIDELIANLDDTSNYFVLPMNAKSILHQMLNDNLTVNSLQKH
jgi:HEAT repeat protein